MGAELVLATTTNLARPISTEDRKLILDDLYNRETAIDGRRFFERPIGFFFHPFSDLQSATLSRLRDASPEGPTNYMRGYQACLVKDITVYLKEANPGTDPMRIYEALLNTGTSAFWDEDIQLV